MAVMFKAPFCDYECTFDPPAAIISVDSTTDALFQRESALKERWPLQFNSS